MTTSQRGRRFVGRNDLNGDAVRPRVERQRLATGVELPGRLWMMSSVASVVERRRHDRLRDAAGHGGGVGRRRIRHGDEGGRTAGEGRIEGHAAELEIARSMQRGRISDEKSCAAGASSGTETASRSRRPWGMQPRNTELGVRRMNSRLERSPSVRGIGPLQAVAAQVQHRQVGEAAQGRRNLPAQAVARPGRSSVRSARPPKAAGISPLKLIGPQPEELQVGEIPQGRPESPRSSGCPCRRRV